MNPQFIAKRRPKVGEIENMIHLCLSNLLRIFLDIHGHRFDPVGVDVGEENLGPLLDDVDELVDALPASLTLPVRLVQEQRLEELLPQPHAR